MTAISFDLSVRRVAPGRLIETLSALCLSLVVSAPVEGFIIDVDPLTDEPLVPWTTTASGTRSRNGEPVTLTWSIVPDGTRVSGGSDFDAGNSDLVEFLNTKFDGDPLQQDLTQQPWFRLFQESFDRWGELSGATYVYEPADDGFVHNTRRGILGVRGDIRIGGMPVDGSGGTLAFNFLPEAGSDMVLDTNDISFYTNPANDFVRFRNTVMHEHGHGFGLQHVNTSTDNILMEPILNTGFDGPQLDDVRGVQFFFGDPHEKSNDGLGNGTTDLATNLGVLSSRQATRVGADANVPTQRISARATDFVSISDETDVDVYSFSVGSAGVLDVTLTPRGGTFTQGSQFSAPSSFNASARSDLVLELIDVDGQTVLASADSTAAGGVERLERVALPAAGEYFARVFTADDSLQLYQLDLLINQRLAGDYNQDGVVDAADYAVWRDMLGLVGVTPGSGADGDLSGSITAADYDIWRQNFGESLGGQSMPLPEPSSAVLLAWVTMLLARAARQG